MKKTVRDIVVAFCVLLASGSVCVGAYANSILLSIGISFLGFAFVLGGVVVSKFIVRN